MNEFLKSRNQITSATQELKRGGYVTHPISCKDWELLEITQRLTHGDLLDMGADGSRVLHNAIIKKVIGSKIGIDLQPVTEDNRAEGADYFVEDLMETKFDDQEFDMIVCQSVIEHQVDYAKFAAETRRLLKNNGLLIVSFDYWKEKVDTTDIKLYGLNWNILDVSDVLNLVNLMKEEDMHLTSKIDWAIGSPVITPQYCSPAKVSYTFGILEFERL